MKQSLSSAEGTNEDLEEVDYRRFSVWLYRESLICGSYSERARQQQPG
jgi:hypothetical protein